MLYKSVLFVCDSNTCRSPMAETLLKHIFAELGLEDEIQVYSGGIASYAREGSMISLDARLSLEGGGFHVSEDFYSKDLKRHKDMVGGADLILTMTTKQKGEILNLQESKGKEVYTLREFVGENGDIDDPGGKGESAYVECKKEIERCLNKVITFLC